MVGVGEVWVSWVWSSVSFPVCWACIPWWGDSSMGTGTGGGMKGRKFLASSWRFRCRVLAGISRWWVVCSALEEDAWVTA